MSGDAMTCIKPDAPAGRGAMSSRAAIIAD